MSRCGQDHNWLFTRIHTKAVINLIKSTQIIDVVLLIFDFRILWKSPLMNAQKLGLRAREVC